MVESRLALVHQASPLCVLHPYIASSLWWFPVADFFISVLGYESGVCLRRARTESCLLSIHLRSHTGFLLAHAIHGDSLKVLPRLKGGRQVPCHVGRVVFWNNVQHQI